MEQIQQLPLDKIVAKTQVRKFMDQEGLDGLAASLKQVGQLQPVRVRREGDKFVLVHGERRWRAAKLAGMATLAVIIEEKDLCEGEQLQRQLIENVQREDLLPLEKAKGITQLMQITGWKIGEVAMRLGLSNASASRLLALLTLPAPIQEKVESGVIPASAAYDLSRIADPDKQSELARELVAGRLTRDGLAGAIKALTKKVATESQRPISRASAPLGDGRVVTVAGTSLNLESFIAALEDLLARARRVRPQGVELGTFIAMLKDQTRSGSPTESGTPQPSSY